MYNVANLLTNAISGERSCTLFIRRTRFFLLSCFFLFNISYFLSPTRNLEGVPPYQSVCLFLNDLSIFLCCCSSALKTFHQAMCVASIHPTDQLWCCALLVLDSLCIQHTKSITSKAFNQRLLVA